MLGSNHLPVFKTFTLISIEAVPLILNFLFGQFCEVFYGFLMVSVVTVQSNCQTMWQEELSVSCPNANMELDSSAFQKFSKALKATPRSLHFKGDRQ